MVNIEEDKNEVILATGGYDHTIRFWSAHNGVCQRIVQHTDSVFIYLLFILNIINYY